MTVIAIFVNFVFLPAPLWLSIAFLCLSRNAAIRCTWGAAALTLGTLVFALVHAADRDPLQWPSVFAFMAALWLLFSAGIGLVVRRIRSTWWPAQQTEIDSSSSAPVLSDNPYEPPRT